jgi:hypothetical protein
MDAMKDGTIPSPTPLQRGAQAGDEVLAQHQFLQAGVLNDLPVESWKEVSLLREENKQSPEKNHPI